MDEAIPDHARKGRGAVSNAAGRYEPTARVIGNRFVHRARP